MPWHGPTDETANDHIAYWLMLFVQNLSLNVHKLFHILNFNSLPLVILKEPGTPVPVQ
jgi:hypothetical protein